MKTKIKKSIIPLIVIAIIVMVATKISPRKVEEPIVEIVSSVVEIGSIVKSLDSLGVISPLEEYSVVSLVTGEILTDNIEIGDKVTKDQILYTIDSEEYLDTIEKAKNTMERQQMTYDDYIEGLDDYNIVSGVSGTVTEVYVDESEKVSSGTRIAEIIDMSYLNITLPFNQNDIESISEGMNADVSITTSGEILSGQVTNVANGSYISSVGGLVCDVTIKVLNPGVLNETYSALAVVNNISSSDSANFVFASRKYITADTSGDIEYLNIARGDIIKSGQKVGEIANSTSETSTRNAQLTYNDAIKTYQTTLDGLDKYTISSPINGTVMEKMYKAGDTLSSGTNSQSSLATVADMSKVKFEMSIDELNIKLVEVGQEVLVTADAIDGVTYKGAVTSIGLMGTQSSGVTTYPVEVVVEEYGDLLPGMNITATIITQSANNVLTIPQSYVSRGNMVLISQSDASKYEKVDTTKANPGQLPAVDSPMEGYVYLSVSVGMSDSELVEITDGLLEGTNVYIQNITYPQTTQTNQENSGFGGMGDMNTNSSGGMNSNASGGMNSNGNATGTTRPGR